MSVNSENPSKAGFANNPMKKKSFLEADSLLQRVESREILMLRACYDQRNKPAGGGRRVPVSDYVKSAESGDRLCEAVVLPPSRILVNGNVSCRERDG